MSKRIYISGQITGLDLKEAEQNFLNKEREVEKDGHTPVNPMKILKFDPKHTWEDYMLADIKELFSCHEIIMLPNWVNSRGAKIEHDIAKHLGLQIHYH